MKKGIVDAPAGKLEGLVQDGVHVFKGVPYAKAPIGPLRWRPPQPHRGWSGVRPAHLFGPTVMQCNRELGRFFAGILEGQGLSPYQKFLLKLMFRTTSPPMSDEDGLNLNVRTPSIDPQAKLPVMVWFHGGAHQGGSNSQPTFNSNSLARHNVVKVEVNYRLGLMGYLAHPALSDESPEGISGNYGTLDQIAALRWVQENIAAFGGDPDNVTLFGESAGGESVLHMMVSPLAKGLFHKAIAQSAATSGQLCQLKSPSLQFEAAETYGCQFAEALGVKGPDVIGQLRDISARRLQAFVNTRHDILGSYFPVLDGHVLPTSPFVAFAQGTQAKIPLLIGSNADEASLLYPIRPVPLPEYGFVPVTHGPGELPGYLKEAFGDDLEALFRLYPGLANGEERAKVELQGDAWLGAPARYYAEQMARQGQPTYLYHFRRVPPSPNQTIGAFHTAELCFVHGSLSALYPMDEEDKYLAQQMMAYWTTFAAKGNPNTSRLPQWVSFDPEQPQWQLLDKGEGGVSSQPVDREDKYKVLHAQLRRKLKQASLVAG